MIDWVKEEVKEGEDPTVLKQILKEEGYNPEAVDKALEHT